MDFDPELGNTERPLSSLGSSLDKYRVTECGPTRSASAHLVPGIKDTVGHCSLVRAGEPLLMGSRADHGEAPLGVYHLLSAGLSAARIFT